MLHLFLDESGDLGFDFINKKPSKFFTITILAPGSTEDNRKLINATKKTLKRKFNLKNPNKIHELKGTSTTLEIKKYFYEQIREVSFSVYSMTLNKKRLYGKLVKNKDRIYNFIAKKVIDQIPIETIKEYTIELIVDKSKGKPEIEDFNNYIRKALEAKVDSKLYINILHRKSHEFHGLQVCDLFSYGIFTSYESNKNEWREVFKEKILFDEIYLV
jgi:hypothetical protein